MEVFGSCGMMSGDGIDQRLRKRPTLGNPAANLCVFDAALAGKIRVDNDLPDIMYKAGHKGKIAIGKAASIRNQRGCRGCRERMLPEFGAILTAPADHVAYQNAQ